MKIRSLLCRYVETVKQQKKGFFVNVLLQPSITPTNVTVMLNQDQSYVICIQILKKNDINMKIWVTFQEVTFLMFFTLLLSGKRGLYSPVNFFFRHYASE